MTYIKNAFAISGDRTEPPFDDPADGSVSYEAGYGAQYSQDPTSISTARRIERLKMNGLFYRLSTELQRLQRQSVPDWISPSENDALSYPYVKGATVRYEISAGVFGVFRSLIDNNTNTPTDTASWYNIDSLKPIVSAKSTDYIITDTDNIETLAVTTGASNATMQLPLLANNQNRLIVVIKADTGAGEVIVDGNGSELIAGDLTKSLYSQYDSIMLVAGPTEWYPIAYLAIRRSGVISVAGSGNYTSGSLKIVKLDNQVLITSNAALTHSSTANAASASGLVPSWAVPTSNMRFFIANNREFLVNTDGSIGSSAGVAVTDTNLPVHASYLIY